jgi:hypothetical protein
MSLPRHVRRTIPAIAAALALGLAACGDDDVERNVEEGAKEAREAGRDAKKAGEDAAREAEEAGEDAARETKKGAKEAERELEK